MGYVTYTDFRQSLASFMDRVCDERTPLVVTRQKGRSVVVLAEEEYDGLIETLHLIRSPANAARLVAAIDELDGGKGTERDLIE